MQAYFEWMPMRNPASGDITSAVWRSFSFGDVATVYATETRLTGRSQTIGWSEVISATEDPSEIAAQAMAHMQVISDPARTMLGAAQEAWLADALAESARAGKTWQVLANQVIMARVAMPDFTQSLTPEQIAAQPVPQVQQMIGFSVLGLPWNLDAWDGYPAARERLYDSVEAAGARLVTLAGDTHTAWANTLADSDGKRMGVEFGCTSITSPGLGDYVTGIPDLGEQFAAANSEVDWFDPTGHGYTIVTLTPEKVTGAFVKISSIVDDAFDVETVAVFEGMPKDRGVSGLTRAS